MTSPLGNEVAARLAETSVDTAGLTTVQVARIEADLGLELPEAVREGIQLWSGGTDLGGINMRSWEPEAPRAWNIVQETLRLRNELGWQARFVYIAEQSESVVVLDAVSERVAWFDSVFAPRLATEVDFPGGDDTDIWSVYLSFLLALCDMEADLVNG